MSSAFNASAESLSASEILAIPLKEPERLYPKDLAEIKKLKNALSQKWHPDKNHDPKAGGVFQHVLELAKSANKKIEDGVWQTPGKLELHSKDGKEYVLRYLKKHDFELGEFYIAGTKTAFVIRGAYKDLYDNGVRTIEGVKFANDKMHKGLSGYIPKIFKKIETKSGDHVLIVERDPNAILLKDYFNHASGVVKPEHVAWMMSRLHNFTSYLEWAGLTHNGLAMDTCFITPKDHDFVRSKPGDISLKDHSLLVMGGWWYAARKGTGLIGLPNRAVNYAPREALASGMADPRIDSTMIRVIGRELLGDVTGVRLQNNKNVPRAMADWLALPGSDSAVKDFKTWREKILKDSFGKPKFVELNVHPNDVYPKPTA